MRELIKFIQEFGLYLAFRARQIFIFAYAAFEVFVGFFSEFKSRIVSRMFWGRGSFYRTSFHIFIFALSAIILISGVSSKLNIFGETANGLGINNDTLQADDLFSQSGTSESVGLIAEDQYDYVVHKYIIKSGDTLSSIANIYSNDDQKININTLVWANNLPNANASLTVGAVLRVPEIDGVFYTVKKGDTLDKIVKTTKSNIPDILDFNRKILDPDNPVLTEGMELFIVGGQIVAPVAPKPVVKINNNTNNNIAAPVGNIQQIPKGTFLNPLKDCGGYQWSRGFQTDRQGRITHGGVDMAKGGGCWIEAAAPGKVTQIGWGVYGEGYHVIIQHANGLKTTYYHGLNKFAVSLGQEVQAGQPIMYMGCSGNCTGTHLHFEIWVGKQRYNPELFLKLR